MASNANEAKAQAWLGKQDHLRFQVALEMNGDKPGDLINNLIFVYMAETERRDPERFMELLKKRQREGGRLGYTLKTIQQKSAADGAYLTSDDQDTEMDISELPENYHEQSPIIPTDN